MFLTKTKYKELHRYTMPEMKSYLVRFYRLAFEQGMKVAESEFDDPEMYQFVNADDARDLLGDELYERLLHDHQTNL